MCHESCLRFGQENLTEAEIRGKRVIEIGSSDVNGSLRAFIESMGPAAYVGVDIAEGPGVDMVCTAEEVRDRFGDASFDVVVSTEVLEHVRDWRKVVSNIKNICRPNGVILLTTRSRGFPYHGYPYDFWRYERLDMAGMFADCTILTIERDTSMPGIFIKATKGEHFREKGLAGIKLYSMISGRRTREIDDASLAAFLERNAGGAPEPKPTGFRRLKKHIDRWQDRIYELLHG